MLFSVPVHFNLTATRIGGERKQSTQAWSLVEFEMQDIADEDIPVVLRWTPTLPGIVFPSSGTRNALGPSPQDKPMHIRKFGENFFKPLMRNPHVNAVGVSQHGEEADFLTGQSAADMLSRYDDGGIFTHTMPGETFQRRLRKNGGDGLADFQSVELHDLNQKVAAITDRLRKHMLVDGVLYERCSEPVIVVFTTEVEINGSKQTGSFALVTADPHLLTTVDKRAEVFQIEDYRAAFAKAQRSNSSRENKDVLNRANDCMMPEIDQLESIYATDVAWMRRVTRIALDITGWIGVQKANDLSEELFNAFKRLRMSLHMIENDERFVLMSEALSTIATVCNGNSATDHLAKQAEVALGILDERPVAVAVRTKGMPAP
ncbi:hypothetical protein O9X98_06430 [Agrobacterium salinitolerans]|nr:hypothetical protein [Agrobacterium salinitolerans]